MHVQDFFKINISGDREAKILRVKETGTYPVV